MSRKTWLLAIVGVVAAGTLTMEVSTHILRGWWRGEAFYRGRPTSYWSLESQRWQLVPT
ncbi:MAG: hypothetical protein L0Y71_18480 [Gemmataceae bacterium]|nr:hypothetical protein [Gemmataceae bacterium]